jgi:hypothetical protein
LGFKAAALEGGFDAWKAMYPVEPVEVERAEASSRFAGFSRTNPRGPWEPD